MALELYSIGNALVDQEFLITEEFLQQQQLQKGTMQLADQAAQNALNAALSAHAQAKGQASGGSAANTTVAFAALGGQAFYGCRVGNDTLGDFYLKDLTRAQVHTSEKSISNGQTGTCMVMITPDGERTMHTYLGITAELSDQQVDLSSLPQAHYLYIEGYLATSPSARIAVKQARQIARQHNTRLALSLSDPAMVQYARDGLVDLLDDGVDVLFCNEQEALLFTCTDTLSAAIEQLLPHSELVVITRGGEGALISTRGQGSIAIDALKVQVVDTNGAGDAFSGAFLFGLTQGFDLSECGRLAAHISGQVVSQYGPRLAVEQYKRILNSLSAAAV